MEENNNKSDINPSQDSFPSTKTNSKFQLNEINKELNKFDKIILKKLIIMLFKSDPTNEEKIINFITEMKIKSTTKYLKIFIYIILII